MLLRLIYDESLAQSAYLIGCQGSGEAIVIDPERDVDRYLDRAHEHGLRLVGAMETHIHADFLSGVRELCARDASIEALLPGEGGADWTHTWPERDGVTHRFLKGGDVVRLGRITIRAVHTPGHTPEHMSYLVTDGAASSNGAIGIVTGDFVFVGDLGRPDLLERAAGIAGSMEAGAIQLAQSARSFAELPEHLQVWPGHGAGSACGKALGAVPTSTVGYELRTNAALRLAQETERFVDAILSGQPEPPAYFARMKAQNRDGAAMLGAVPVPVTVRAVDVPQDTVVLDTRAWPEFLAGHHPGAISAPLDNTFPTIAGSYVDPASTVALVVDEADCDEAVRRLVRVGIDRVAYRVDPGEDSRWGPIDGYEITVREAQQRLLAGAARALDVRRRPEHVAGHLPGAANVAHVQLRDRLDEVPAEGPVLVCCRSGVRSARATSYLRSLGIEAYNVRGGFLAWDAAGLPVEHPEAVSRDSS